MRCSPHVDQVSVLAAVLDRLVLTNSGRAGSARTTKFSAQKRPAITVIDYLERCVPCPFCGEWLSVLTTEKLHEPEMIMRGCRPITL
jgi:hypothetical protein